jgi:hypothetical protein
MTEVIAIYSSVIGLKQEAHGWFMLLEGSWEWLFVGAEKPDFAPGDRVKITIAKREEAVAT